LAAKSYTPYTGDLAEVALEVIDVGLHRLTGRPVLFAAVLVVADELLLLPVDTDHWLSGGDVLLGRSVDMGELGIPVGMSSTLDRLGVALQAEVLLPQQRRHGRRGHPVAAPGELVG